METQANQNPMQMANQNEDEHIIDIEDRSSVATNQTSPSSSHVNVNTFNSGIWISVQMIVSVIQIVASISVLWASKRDENPAPGLFAWVVGYASGCLLMLPLLYCRYRFARTFNIRLFGAVELFSLTLSCFFVVWFVLGNVLVFGVPSSHRAPKLETLCLVFLATGCLVYGMPAMRCATGCLLLPCLIFPILTSREEETRGATGDSFNALPTYRFKLRENGTGEGGVLAAGTEKERALSGEDAVCCICLGKYVDNDELRELPCGHFFHVECVDEWLKISARCPLCQSELGRTNAVS